MFGKGIAMLIAVGVLFAFIVTVCFAQTFDDNGKPLPDAQWTESAALWLARAQVAEAGWTGTVDHDAIAWVLQRQWRRAPIGTTFETVVRQYCNSLDEHRPRATWLLTLELDGSVPVGWPRGLSWPLHRPLWERMIERGQEWADGNVPDPTGGRALHWGSLSDGPPPASSKLVPLNLNTRNIFYARGR